MHDESGFGYKMNFEYKFVNIVQRMCGDLNTVACNEHLGIEVD